MIKALLVKLEYLPDEISIYLISGVDMPTAVNKAVEAHMATSGQPFYSVTCSEVTLVDGVPMLLY